MVEYGFHKGVDFNPLIFARVQQEGGREVNRTITDHAMSLDMCKEIAMIQRTKRGKQARQYFIECERRLLERERLLERDRRSNDPQEDEPLEIQFARMVLTADKLLQQKNAVIAEQTFVIENQYQKIEYQHQEIEQHVQKIEEDRPKVIFANAVAASPTSITVYELAKLIRQNGIIMGGKRLFEIFRARSFLCRQKGSQWNLPTQKSMDMGLFEIQETVITCPDGRVIIKKTSKITGKGQEYFINLFLTNKVAQ
jgi:anti-repressor protein